MTTWFNSLLAKVDALALRERVLLLMSLLICGIAATNTWLLAPVEAEQTRLQQSLRREAAELETLRAKLRSQTQAMVQKQGEGGELAELEQVRKRSAQMQQEIDSLRVVGAERAGALPEVLRHFLRRHEGLLLVRVATLTGDAAQTAPHAAASAAAVASRRMGVELTVSGPYLELMNYVQTLEQSLPRLRWGSMKLMSENQTPQLTLQVFYVEAP